MELGNQIIVNAKPAVLEANFDHLKESLTAELEKYRIIVTADTIADAKKLATELNATKKIIDERRKLEVAKASEPVKQFDENMKELVIMCAKGREDIISQVKVFEDKAREKCRNELLAARDYLWKKNGIDETFRRTEIEALVKVTGITPQGKLTKGSKDALSALVRDDKDLQDQTYRRGLELENECYKAGLKTPLQLEHVKDFLFQTDDVYRERLAGMITVEVTREAATEQKLREKINAEQLAKAQVEAETQAKAAPDPVETKKAESVTVTEAANEPESEPVPAPASTANDMFTITCIFNTEAPAAIQNDKIESHVRATLAKAGITTLSHVLIERNKHLETA